MKVRKFNLFLGAVLLAVSSCVVDNMTQTSTQVLERINTLEEQATAIENSISELKKVDEALATGIVYLEAKRQADSLSIDEQIKNLQEQDSLVKVRISELQSYTEQLVSDTKDWSSGTFATLEQYDTLCGVVAGLDARIDSLDLAHTTALNQSIATLESSMKDWVNEKFTDYYTIEEINVRLDALFETDSTMYKEIEDLYVALDEAKVEITEAYTKAIETAIKESEGRMSEKITQQVDAAKAELTGVIDVLDERVTAIEARVTVLEDKVQTLEGQVKKINESISDLETVDKAVQESIDYLKARAAGDSASIKAINSQIATLQKQDSIISEDIQDLRHYVDSLSKDTRDWVNGTFATLEQYKSLCETVAALDTKMDSLDVAHTAALNQSITDLETSMKDWVNEKFTDYYTIAQIDAKLEELRKADSTLNQKIDNLSTALVAAEARITAAYTEAINTAITELEGRLNEKIETDIAAAKAELQGRIEAISQKIVTIEENMQDVLSRIQSISVIPDLSDGSVKAVWNDSTFTLRLSVYPLDAAQKIADNTYMQTSVEMVETATKSSSAFKQLVIKDMKYEDELLKLTVSATGIPEECYSGVKRAFARVLFSNNKYQKASDMFPMTSVCYADALELVRKVYSAEKDSSFSLQYKITPNFFSPAYLTCSSSDTDVATVDNEGVVTMHSDFGSSCNIVVRCRTTDGEVSDTCIAGVCTLPGIFSISSTQKVKFSAGSLRARKGSASDWSDAIFFICNDQLSALGKANVSGSSLADEIDLFGWSGDTGGAHWGISTSNNNSSYSGDFKDWAQNIGTGWKTMVRDETNYLFNERPNHSSLCKAPVTVADYVDCIVLAPDDFTGTIQSSYTESEWREAEKLGLVCIISSGYRSVSSINLYKQRVDWWTATPSNSTYAYTISVNTAGTPSCSEFSRYYGQTVRLVYVISE